MALELNINVTEDSDCLGIQVFETTGAYSAANTTGWDEAGAVVGIPATTDALTATLTIKHPDGTEVVIDVSGTFPTTDNTIPFAISNTDLGFSDSITPGIYLFTYDVTTGGEVEFDYTKQCYVLLRCSANCCIDQMFAKVDTGDCATCSDTNLKRAIEAQGYLCAAISALGCDRITDAQALIDKVNYLCELTNCKCGS